MRDQLLRLQQLYGGHYIHAAGPGKSTAERAALGHRTIDDNHKRFPWNPEDRTGVRGFGFMSQMENIEGAKGNYNGADMPHIKAYLEKCEKHGTKLMLTIADVAFNASDLKKNFLPKYLIDEGYLCFGGNPSNRSTQAKMWEAHPMERYITMLKAVYDELKGSTAFAGFETFESARAFLSGGDYLNISDKMAVQYARMVAEMRSYMDADHVFFPHYNYCKGSDDHIPSLVTKHRALGQIEVSTPDTILRWDPNYSKHTAKTLPFYNEQRALKDLGLVSNNIQTRDGAVDPGVAWSLMYDHPEGAQYNLNPSIVVWFMWHPESDAYQSDVERLLVQKKWHTYQSPAEAVIKDSVTTEAPEITTDISFTDEGNIDESPTAEGDSSEGETSSNPSDGEPSAALRLPGPYAGSRYTLVHNLSELKQELYSDFEYAAVVISEDWQNPDVHADLLDLRASGFEWFDGDGVEWPCLVVSEALLRGKNPVDHLMPVLPPIILGDTESVIFAGVSLSRGLDRAKRSDNARPVHIGYNCKNIRFTRFEMRDVSDGFMTYAGCEGVEFDHYVLRDQKTEKGKVTDVVGIGFAGKMRDRQNGKRSIFGGVKIRNGLAVNWNDHIQTIGDGDGSIPDWDEQASAPDMLIENVFGLTYPDQYVTEGGVEKMPFENLIADLKFGSHDPNNPVVVRNCGAKGARPTASWGGSGGHGYPIDMHFGTENVVIDGLRLEDCCNGVGMVGKVRNIIARRGVLSGIKQLGNLTTTGHGITAYGEKGNVPENIFVQDMIFADVDKPIANNSERGLKRCDTLTVTGSHRAGSTPEIPSYMITEASQQLAAISPGSEAFNRLTESASTDMIAEAWNYARKPIFDDYTDEEIAGDSSHDSTQDATQDTDSTQESEGSSSHDVSQDPDQDKTTTDSSESETDSPDQDGGVDIDLGDDLSGDVIRVLRGINRRLTALEEKAESETENQLLGRIEELEEQNEALAKWLTAAPVVDDE